MRASWTSIWRDLGNGYEVGVAQYLLGEVFWLQGNFEQARQIFTESLQHNHDLYDRRGMLACLAAFASVALLRERPSDALRLLGAVDTVLKVMGASLLPVDGFEYDRTLVAARSNLNEAEAVSVWAEGQALSLEGAIEFVNQLVTSYSRPEA